MAQVEHEVDIQNMQSSLGSLTIAGIDLFFYTCIIQAIYTISITSLGFYGIMGQMQSLGVSSKLIDHYFSLDPKHHSVFQSEYVRETVHWFFLGAGCVASAAAIGNIVLVETVFHESFKQLNPSAKFWGIKILVTLAFMQSCVLLLLPPFSSWPAVRSNLLYASCLTLECFLLSLSHLWAWHHDEDWYDESPDNEELRRVSKATVELSGLQNSHDRSKYGTLDI